MKATVLRTSIIFAGLFVFSGFGQLAQAAMKFEMVVTGESPYPLLDRKDLSLNTGGGKGVLISPRWAMTGSHCITSRKQKAGKVTVIFPGPKGKKIKVKVTKVLRHKSKDIALLQLARAVKPAERMPVLLLREKVLGKFPMKKCAGNAAWRNIPAVGKKDNFAVPNKKDRKGIAGTSGSPWLMHSKTVGDVLIGVTHGSGRAPSVAWVSRWIQETVNKNGGAKLVWATAEQARGKNKVPRLNDQVPRKFQVPTTAHYSPTFLK